MEISMTTESLAKLQAQIVVAMKAREQDRLTVLRMLMNRAKLSAKNDGNREATDADLLQAATKTVKEANDTRAIYVERGVDTLAQDNEIAIVSEFLPEALSEDELRGAIRKALDGFAGEPKQARGHVMKTLNGEHKGAFDPAKANQLLAEML
jgi:uncharacterized protein YqeY